MTSYTLPLQLNNDTDQLELLIKRFQKGEIPAAELKAHRVPFGIYEQQESDTYMVRIRCAAGFIAPSQLEAVAKTASQFRVTDIHITTRQELQIHYVKLDDIIPILRLLQKAGLASRGGGGNTVRNITTQDDAGFDPQEVFDVTPYAIALTSRLIAEEDSWNLPRKFKIAFSGSAEDKGFATITDVGFIAKINQGIKGFSVFTAGGLGAKSAVGKQLFSFVDAAEVYPITKALKNLFWKYGNRKNKNQARLRFLWDLFGQETFIRKFHEEYAQVKESGSLPLEIDETVYPAAIQELIAEEPDGINDFVLWKDRYVVRQKQPDLFSVLVPVELGFISADTAIRLAKFLTPFGDSVLRLTKGQNFLLHGIPAGYLGNVYNFLKTNFADISRPALLARIVSCAGASTCQLGICLSRQAVKHLKTELEKSQLDLDQIESIRIHVSGCPNSCGQHTLADLGFSGKALRKDSRLYPAYHVVAGAVISEDKTTLAKPVGDIPAKALPAFVKDILSSYLSKRLTYKNFRNYIMQEKERDIKQICERYQAIPAFEEDKNYYFDWGAENLFSLAERRAGECSAGLYDLIGLDQKNITETKKSLIQITDEKQKNPGLAQLLVYACRMLLITRGVESNNQKDLSQLFSKHFLETGYIDFSYKNLLDTMQEENPQSLQGRDTEILQFVSVVEDLYNNMDNAFNFKKPVVADPQPPEKKSDQENKYVQTVVQKDFRGVVCPLNFVKTKVELSKLSLGERLEIWLDDGEPIENVPGSVQAEGHKVISVQKTGTYWSVVIEKQNL